MNPAEIIQATIGDGEENAVKCQVLEDASGLNARDVKKVIEDLRRNGTVICSNEKGYFYPVRLYELHGFIQREVHRAKSILRTLQSAEDLFYDWSRMQDD